MRTFSIRCYRHNGFKATCVQARDAASAARMYADTNHLGNVILPLRNEQPTHVFTENSHADYVTDQCMKPSATQFINLCPTGRKDGKDNDTHIT